MIRLYSRPRLTASRSDQLKSLGSMMMKTSWSLTDPLLELLEDDEDEDEPGLPEGGLPEDDDDDELVGTVLHAAVNARADIKRNLWEIFLVIFIMDTHLFSQ